jgi:hypothetical protein
VEQGRFGLPRHIDQLCVLRSPGQTQGPLYAVATSHSDLGTCDAEVVDASGNRYVLLKGYRTVVLPAGASSAKLKVLQTVA